MTVKEIKNTYSMRDILAKCGLPQPNRAGFIVCPFHMGDREPSMKIYEKDYHCFGCGANGDIFLFLQDYCNITFNEAFMMLGGTHEKPTFASQMNIYHAKQKQKQKEKAAVKLKRQQKLNNDLIDIYREWYQKSEPFSDTWCDCYNALQYQLYIHEILSGGVAEK